MVLASQKAKQDLTIFKHTLLLMEKIGIRAYSDDIRSNAKKRFFYFLPRLMVIILFLDTIINQYLHWYFNWYTMPPVEVPRLVVFLNIAVLTTVHLGNFYIRSKRARQLFISVDMINIKYSSEKKRHHSMTKRTSKISHFLVKYFIPALYATFFFLSIAAFIFGLKDEGILQGHYFPFDVRISPYYEIAVMYCILVWVPPLSLMLTIQILSYVWIIHLMNQFRILHEKLLNIRADSLEQLMTKACQKTENSRTQVVMELSQRVLASLVISESKERPRVWKMIGSHRYPFKYKKKLELDLEMKRRLEDCIQHHQALISLYNEGDDLCQPNCISGLLFSLVSFALAVGYASFVSSIDTLTFFMVVIIFFCGSILGLYCWMCDKLTEESSLVRDAAYGCDWFDSTEGFKRSIRIIMSRANQPLMVRAAGFILFNLETFRDLLKATHGYYSVLSNVIPHASDI